MAKDKAKRKTKLPVFRSRGVMRDATRAERLVTAVVLALMCAALTFTQLGFAAVPLPGGTMAYAVVLLLPIAVGALLLGTLIGTCIGLFAGAVLCWHASAMPLDYYELTFVTPLTSVVMLTVCGFLLGFLFAFVLRHDPGRVKRAIYIVIVCVIVSLLYSLGFTVNVILQTVVMTAVETVGLDQSSVSNVAESNATIMALRLGRIDVEMVIDAVLMAVFCILADVLSRRAMRIRGEISLRGMFAARLSVVVLIVFMITAGASFAAITHGKIVDAEKHLTGEADYLCRQLAESDVRADSLISFMESKGIDLGSLDEENLSNLRKLMSIDALLDGYEKDSDGTILVTLSAGYGEDGKLVLSDNDYFIELSDNENFPKEQWLSNYVDDEVLDAIAASISDGKVHRVVFDDTQGETIKEVSASRGAIHSEIVYLCAKQTSLYTVVVMKTAGMVFSGRGSLMGWTTLSALLLLAAVYAMVFLLLSRVVVRRIDDTNGVLSRITEGDLEARVDIRDTLEFKSLSNGINTTVDALKGWIAEAETRMDAELSTAKAIQESALPRTFPPFPDIQRFDVYASMKPAREVGGDFYDFFLVGEECNADDGKLGFVVADVSGKGVPAALFMMKAMTLIRDYLQSGMEVGEAVENANRKLCEGNDAEMFVTAWVGVLDYATGHVEYVNAGHNPPLLWQREGGWRWLQDRSGMPLGLFDGLPYESYAVDCGIGDQFLLYTDGVTEAMDEDGELYGERRLEELVNSSFTLHPRRLVDAVRRGVSMHAQGAEQSDDITILSLEVGVPPELTATITVPADVSELPTVNEFIHTELDRRLCPKRTQNQLDIAVEELFVNVAHYAYPDATDDNPGTARISYTYSADPPSVRVDIADDGIPYNPLAKPDAVTPDDIADVPIGGLGILMAKRSVDDMTYERVDGSNVVTIIKKW